MLVYMLIYYTNTCYIWHYYLYMHIFVYCAYISIFIYIHIHIYPYPYTHMDMYALCKTIVRYYPILQINRERAKKSMEISRLL